MWEINANEKLGLSGTTCINKVWIKGKKKICSLVVELEFVFLSVLSSRDSGVVGENLKCFNIFLGLFLFDVQGDTYFLLLASFVKFVVF